MNVKQIFFVMALALLSGSVQGATAQDISSFIDCVKQREYTQAKALIQKYDDNDGIKKQFANMSIDTIPLVWYVLKRDPFETTEVSFLKYFIEQGLDVTTRLAAEPEKNIFHELAMQKVDITFLIPLIHARDQSLINEPLGSSNRTPVVMFLDNGLLDLGPEDLKDYPRAAFDLICLQKFLDADAQISQVTYNELCELALKQTDERLKIECKNVLVKIYEKKLTDEHGNLYQKSPEINDFINYVEFKEAVLNRDLPTIKKIVSSYDHDGQKKKKLLEQDLFPGVHMLSWKRTALFKCMEGENDPSMPISRYLIEQGAEFHHGSYTILDVLSSTPSQIDPSFIHYLFEKDEWLRVHMLHEVSRSIHLEILEVMMSHGVTINEPSYKGLRFILEKGLHDENDNLVEHPQKEKLQKIIEKIDKRHPEYKKNYDNQGVNNSQNGNGSQGSGLLGRSNQRSKFFLYGLSGCSFGYLMYKITMHPTEETDSIDNSIVEDLSQSNQSAKKKKHGQKPCKSKLACYCHDLQKNPKGHYDDLLAFVCGIASLGYAVKG